MKSKRLALAALLISGLLVPLAAARPHSASAGAVCDALAFHSFGLLNCMPFGEPAPCTLNNVNVGALSNFSVAATANGSRNTYVYDVGCEDGSVHVYSSFDFPTGKASENIRNGEFALTAAWNCAHDPWIAPSPQTCTR